MKTLRTLLFILIAALGILAFSVGMEYVSIKVGGFLGQAQEEERREIYEESRTNMRGTIEDLRRYKLKYEKSDSHKESLRGLILEKARNVPNEDLPRDLREWVKTLRREE